MVLFQRISNTTVGEPNSDGNWEKDTDRKGNTLYHESNLVVYTDPNGPEPPAVWTADDVADILEHTPGGAECSVQKGSVYARSRISDDIAEDEKGPATRRSYYSPLPNPYAKEFSNS